jgi:CPA1 family monovalent cation:H+ antiporter
MQAVELLMLLLGTTAALGVMAERFRLPAPVLLVLGGIGLAMLPTMPPMPLRPETVFLLFVPPLLYRAALNMSLFEMRRRARGIAFLSITMVLATMIIVAVAAHAVIPGLPWAAAFVLGAIVSPPDSVAAISLTRSVRLPRSIATLLRGEGLVNDAAAFVAYRIAVAALVSGTFSVREAASDFVTAAGVGVAIGVAVGWTIARLRERMRDMPVVENTISLLTPFAAFVPAEQLGASSVLAVVATGLYLGHWAPRTISPTTRLQANAMWDMIVFLLEGLIFVLVGFELPRALDAISGYATTSLALWGAVVAAAVILSRMVLVIPRPYLEGALRRWRGHPRPLPAWSLVLFVSWAGVRGGESLVIALALPLTTVAGSTLPARDLIIFLTFAVILSTLVVQGLTFGMLARVLGIQGDADEEREEASARAHLRAVGAERLSSQMSSGGIAPAAATQARALLRLDVDVVPTPKVLGEIFDAQRAALLSLFDAGRVSGEVMRRLLHELDLQVALLDRPPAARHGQS